MTNQITIEAVNQIRITKDRNWYTISIYEGELITDVFQVQDSITAIQQLNKRGQKLTRGNRSDIKSLIK